MASSFVLPLSRNWFFENAPREDLNFSACLLELHSVFHVLFLLVVLHALLVALHPLTGIEQVIYQWKAALNTQLSRVDHFFILATILKVFHLIFIQCRRWTSCCFYVELLWSIFHFYFFIHFFSVTQMVFLLYNPLSQYFFNFLQPRTWTYTNDIPCRFEVIREMKRSWCLSSLRMETHCVK